MDLIMAKIAMEWPNDLLSWVFVFLASLALVLLQLQQWSKLPLPPGPKPLPIVGNLMMIGQLTHQGLAALAERYGGLLHLRLGRRHVFVVSTAEYARDVLQAQDVAFANRPTTTAIAYLTYGHADMAFAQYGPFWRQARKLSAAKLFSRRRAQTWLAVRDESAALVGALAQRSGEAVNLGELILNLSRNVVFRAAFGTCACEDDLGENIGVLKEFSRHIGDFAPWLAWIDLNRRRLRETRKGFDRFIDKIFSSIGGSQFASYLLDYDTVTQLDDEFNIIIWWHQHKLTYPVLSILAKDILIVPISTIFSEGTFSTTDRILEERPWRLNSETLEILTCIKGWEAAESRLQHMIEDKELEASFESLYLDE